MSPADTMTRLFADHGDAVAGYLLRLTDDVQEAEDLMQETMLRALKDPRTERRSSDHQRAWLHVVARNLAIDRLRSAYHRREYSDDADPPASAASATATSATATPGDPGWAEEVLDRWLISEALASISPAHREVIVRGYYWDESVAQIADDLGIPAGTVKSRMHHGMRALRIALEERGVTSR